MRCRPPSRITRRRSAKEKIVARDTGMALRVHGRCVEVVGVLKQPTKLLVTNMEPKQHTAPTKTKDAVQPPPAREEASPPAVSKRKQSSAQRLLDFQEKVRAAKIANAVAQGCDPVLAQVAQARLERKRLERRASERLARAATPMAADPAPVDGLPRGTQEGQPCSDEAAAKRARVLLPEAG